MKKKYFKTAAIFAFSIGIGLLSFANDAMAKSTMPVIISRGFSDELSAQLSSNYALEIGDLKLSAMAYEQAWRKNPSSKENFDSAVRASFMTGEYENALEIAKNSNSKLKSPTGDLIIANEDFLEGKYDDAIKLLEKGEFDNNTEAYGRQLLSWSLLAKGEKDQAMTKAAETTAIRSLEKSVYYSRAILYDFAGEKQKAADAYEIAYASGSRVSLGLVSYAKFLTKNGEKERALQILSDTGPSHAANEFLFETQGLIKDGKLNTQSKPDLKAAAANSLGIIAIALSEDLRNGSPLGVMALANRLDDNLLQVKLSSGAMLYGLGLEAEGLKKLGEIPKNTVFGDQAQALIANLTFADNPKQALEIARNLVKSRPSFSNKATLASLLLGSENYKESEALYSELLKDFSSKSPQEANIEKWQLLFGRANSSLGLNKTQSAIKDLRTALILEPNNSMVLNTLGYTLADAEIDLDEAMELIEKSLEISPKAGETIDSLGWVLFKKKQYEEALDSLELAFSVTPTIGEVADHLGDAYWVTGRHDEARLEWSKALALYKSPAAKAKVKSKMTNGLNAPVKVTSNKK